MGAANTNIIFESVEIMETYVKKGRTNMKAMAKIFTVLISVMLFAVCMSWCPSVAKAEKPIPGSMANKVPEVKAAFDVSKMSDMSDFDPSHPVIPTGDTVKIAVVWPHSGPASLSGEIAWICFAWVAHDINKRGGIFVDGKKKLVEIIKADSMSRPDQTKKITERMVLQDNVKILAGTSGSNIQKIINEVANKYKIIAMNLGALSDDLQDATNFSRYAFMSSPSTEQVGRAMAYYYGQIHKKEKKFYILCQDYSFGHELADGFKKGLKEYYPEAQLVGEDYHKLFLTDFAPYLTKIKASGAEVIYTGDWMPDAGNLLKQARQLGIMIPFAQLYINDPKLLAEVGVEGTKGLILIDQHDTPDQFKDAGYVTFYKAWNHQWKTKWKTPPYNSILFEHGGGSIGSWIQQAYWLMSVLERAKSLDPEKIIQVWEGDTFKFANGRIVKMRACDHKGIQDFTIGEYFPPEQQKDVFAIPPYYASKNYSYSGKAWLVPSSKALPWMDQKLDRCVGKNGWGE
jgi:branched-chain amino acid transport system substrate-binding protein